MPRKHRDALRDGPIILMESPFALARQCAAECHQCEARHWAAGVATAFEGGGEAASTAFEGAWGNQTFQGRSKHGCSAGVAIRKGRKATVPRASLESSKTCAVPRLVRRGVVWGGLSMWAYNYRLIAHSASSRHALRRATVRAH